MCSTIPPGVYAGKSPSGIPRGAEVPRTVAAMRVWHALRSWMREHALAVDTLLAVVLVIPALQVPSDARFATAGAAELPGPLRLITVLACLALAGRRRWPTAVWLIAAAPAVYGVLVVPGPSGTLLPLLVALYTLATRWEPRNALAAGAASGLALLGTDLAKEPTAWAVAATWVPVTWCVLATVVGIAVRTQRRTVAAARERARQAEESRDEEARRRVSEERLRIARELHDVVAHHIAVITVQSGVAEHLLPSDPAAARAAIDEVRTAGREVLAEMGVLLGVLRAAGEEAGREPVRGLADVDALVDSFRHAGLRVELRHEGERTTLAPLVDVTVYRVLEEALTNASRHGVDGSADVSIAQVGTTTVLEVRNRIVRAPDPDAVGHGLVGMRERVAAVGGVIEAGPDGAGRFRVRVEVPTVTPIGHP